VGLAVFRPLDSINIDGQNWCISALVLYFCTRISIRRFPWRLCWQNCNEWVCIVLILCKDHLLWCSGISCDFWPRDLGFKPRLEGRGTNDSVAEWLRRWIANPLLFERVSSNLTTVAFCTFCVCVSCVTSFWKHQMALHVCMHPNFV
jgi:hypothetical protein